MNDMAQSGSEPAHRSLNLRNIMRGLRRNRGSGTGRILFTRAQSSAERVLVFRLALTIALFALVLVVFLLDRSGLKDESDNIVSFSDVLYFTMVTITTVGYGDIVPVSTSARMVDALLVTPIRIFVWFIFFGTAYQLVIQRVVEDWRMGKLQRRLDGHIIICGYGNSGRSAAKEMLGKGIAPEDTLVVDSGEAEVRAATDDGLVALHGDATREELLRVAAVARARGIVVTVGRDDTALMIVLTARALSATAQIVVSVHEQENVKLLRNAGADTVVTPWTFGGYLLADALTQRFTVDILQDALSPGGELNLHERAPTSDEVGQPARTLRHSLVLGVVRDKARVMFWQDPELKILPNDRLIALDARQS